MYIYEVDFRINKWHYILRWVWVWATPSQSYRQHFLFTRVLGWSWATKNTWIIKLIFSTWTCLKGWIINDFSSALDEYIFHESQHTTYGLSGSLLSPLQMIKISTALCVVMNYCECCLDNKMNNLGFCSHFLMRRQKSTLLLGFWEGLFYLRNIIRRNIRAFENLYQKSLCFVWFYVKELVVVPSLQHVFHGELDSSRVMISVVDHHHVHFTGGCHGAKVIIINAPTRDDLSQFSEAISPKSF